MASFGSKILDSLLISLGAIMVAICALLFNNDSFIQRFVQVKRSHMTQTIGETRTTLNDVRRRSRGSLSWIPLARNQKVFDRDTIFTGPKSGVELHLNQKGNDQELSMRDNTLLQFVSINGETLLDLQVGSITSNLKKGEILKIKIGNKTSEIKASKNTGTVKIVKSQSNETTSISSQKGQLDVSVDARLQTLTQHHSLKSTAKKSR